MALKAMTALLLAGGAYWVVRMQQLGRINLPAVQPAAETIPAPEPPRPELASFEDGLGIGLRIGARWDEVAAATKDWGVQWQPAVSGVGRERATAPGISIGLDDGFVRSYNIELAELARQAELSQWVAQLRAQGLYAGLAYEKYSGEKGSEREERWLSSGQSVELGQAAYNPAYCLVFLDGKLKELRGAVAVPGGG